MLYDPTWDRTKLDPVSKLLLEAADLIDKHGLAKGTQRAEDGSMCIAGAINMAAVGRTLADGYPDWAQSPAKKAYDRIAIFCGAPHQSETRFFVQFNNHPDTTKEMVVEKLRACALQDA